MTTHDNADYDNRAERARAVEQVEHLRSCIRANENYGAVLREMEKVLALTICKLDDDFNAR